MSADKVLCYIGGGVVAVTKDGLATTAFFGKVVNELASRFKTVILVVPTVPVSEAQDFVLATNVKVRVVPSGGSALGNFKVSRRWRPVVSSAVAESDFVFIRGLFTPALGYIYRQCKAKNKPLLHWLIGNPKALLETHRRNGLIKDVVGKLYTRFWCAYLDFLHNLSHSAGYICNGSEILDAFSRRNSWSVVSSTLSNGDYYWREDTCVSEPIIVGTLCYLRPEKGIEYLLEAMGSLRDMPVELHLYGGFGKYSSYEQKLHGVVERNNLHEKVKFMGPVRSVDVPVVMRKLDVFVLPTLSEGTPRVILEAQANCVPVIASKVGGIPDMIVNGESGVLVSPKSAVQLAEAIGSIVENGDKRRGIIFNAYNSAKRNNLASLVCNIVDKYKLLGG